MKLNEALISGYENTKLVNYEDLSADTKGWVKFSDLPNADRTGVLKAGRYVNGELMQLYTEQENHVGVVAGTRLGKTTSYVIPSVLSFACRKVKRSMIISDPKGEIYRTTSETLKKQGYKVRLLNFRNYQHSECWNMLTPIYRKFRRAHNLLDEVELIQVNGEWKNKFNNVVYDDQNKLDYDLENAKAMMVEECYNDVDNVARMIITTENTRDPYWEDSARDLLKAFLFAMLEDSLLPEDNPNRITEDTFSFSTILRVLIQFKDDTGDYDDNGYFTKRPADSQAYLLAKNNLIENAKTTRKCVMGSFTTKMSVFRESAMRLITSCNSFEISELTEGPIALFINYRDELKAHYQIISLFVQDAYRFLIEKANEEPLGKLPVPFYFILDEFGNFPCMRDFETTISACAGRNIFFILIVQSYAQLYAVYGKDVAEIIKDNLNVHIFFGSNNPDTLEAFSRECGEHTRLSPLSALNGETVKMQHYQFETIPLVPKSRLAHLNVGECIVTEANCGYVMLSRLERYYLCKEFNNLPQSSDKDYVCSVNPFDKRYIYDFKPQHADKKKFNFDF